MIPIKKSLNLDITDYFLVWYVIKGTINYKR